MKKLLNVFLCVLFIIFFSNCNKKNTELTLANELISPNYSKGQLKSSTLNCDWVFQYVDNFNNAISSNDYGLNDNLAARQLYGAWKNTTWIRKEGTWYDKIILPWYSQVNHPVTPNVLSFHLGHSAVMLNRLVSSGAAGRYRVSFTTDPVKNDQGSGCWTSFMLNNNGNNRGFVTGTEFGFSIGSNGGVQVFQNGNLKTSTGTVTAASEYKVVLDIMPNQLVANVNGTIVTAVLNEALPTSAYVFLGAYIETGSGFVSWLDDLIINTQHQTGEGRIKNYGYYWASSGTYGEHLSEVSDYTNFNFIESITPGLPNTKTHVLQARWQFWSNPDGTLNPNWLDLWNILLADINLNIDKIAALYICDEPFWAVNVKLSDYNTVLSRVKADLPNLPVIAVFAHPVVDDMVDTRIANVSNNLNWVGADKYVSVNDFSQVTSMNSNLMNKRPNNNIFLIPQTFFSGTLNDAALSEINWMFYTEALNNTKVIGLWNFGLWTHQTPAEVPITLETQKLIGRAIISY